MAGNFHIQCECADCINKREVQTYRGTTITPDDERRAMEVLRMIDERHPEQRRDRGDAQILDEQRIIAWGFAKQREECGK
jgi:hypothetical protein